MQDHGHESTTTAGQGEGHSADGLSHAQASNYNEAHQSHGTGDDDQGHHSFSRSSSAVSESFETSTTSGGDGGGGGGGKQPSQTGQFDAGFITQGNGHNEGTGADYQSDNVQGNAGGFIFDIIPL